MTSDEAGAALRRLTGWRVVIFDAFRQPVAYEDADGRVSLAGHRIVRGEVDRILDAADAADPDVATVRAYIGDPR